MNVRYTRMFATWMKVIPRATARMLNCLAATISARRAAVVRSVSSEPRSFSPAMLSIATTEPPLSINMNKKKVRKRPTKDPLTCPGVARLLDSTSTICLGSAGKPRPRKISSLRTRRTPASNRWTLPRPAFDSSRSPWK